MKSKIHFLSCGKYLEGLKHFKPTLNILLCLYHSGHKV